MHFSLDDPRPLVRHCAWVVYDVTCRQICKGEQTPCAAGFYECACDVGPVSFLLNTDGVEAAGEVHLFGCCVLHCS